MNQSLNEIVDEQVWEDFSPLKEQGLFLQSFHQKELYCSLGQRTWLFEQSTPDGAVRSLVTKIKARRGTFLFLPYGPMMEKTPSKLALGAFFDALKNVAKQEQASFLRISPFWEESRDLRNLFSELGFRPAPIHMLAETLWILDLHGKSEDEILSGMEKKHRNLVKRAVKDGVEIRTATSDDGVKRFIELHRETVDRHRFTPYPENYFYHQVKFFSREHQVEILEAWQGTELLASGIIMFYGKGAAYHHGASSSRPEHKKIPASYLLQWQAIRMAIERSCTHYNFWGIAPEDDPKHPFYGITHFKKGFGGERRDLMPCHDLPLSTPYALNWAIEKVRKWKRGF